MLIISPPTLNTEHLIHGVVLRVTEVEVWVVHVRPLHMIHLPSRQTLLHYLSITWQEVC